MAQGGSIMISAILDSRATSFLARLILTSMFWTSGLAKVLDWKAGLADMAHFHLAPAPIYCAATAATEILGSVLVLWGPYCWLGAGWLGVFTALTIPIAHNFWAMPQPQATQEMYTAVEHTSIIGALILAAIVRRKESQRRR